MAQSRIKPGLSRGMDAGVAQRAVAQLEDFCTDADSRMVALESLGFPMETPPFLTGVGTFVFKTGTVRAFVEMMAAGGSGGGGLGGANTSAGSGGASGIYLAFWLYNSGQALVGGAYSAGLLTSATSGAGGTNGADTTITLNGTLYTAKGGGGGLLTGSVTGAGVAGGATQAGSSTPTGAITSGNPGSLGMVLGVAWGGNGGASPWGIPGRGPVGAVASGGNATGYGAGGGGAVATTINGPGGQGAPGAIRIWEFPR